MTAILKFKDEFDWLSNFYTRPNLILWDGIYFAHSEGIYQLMKDKELSSNPAFIKEFSTYSAAETKQWGKHHARLREDWDDIKVDVMYFVVREKFVQNQDLLDLLINTGSQELVEGNWWHDNFWGTCPVGSKNGRNELGKILMRIRTEFTGYEHSGIIRY